MNKKDLSERDICSKYITPSLINAGWNLERQIREEVTFTDGRIIVRKKLVTRGERKRADYILYYKPNLPLAIIEAKDNKQGSQHFFGQFAKPLLKGARFPSASATVWG